jgi:hypothetical protein
MWYYLWIFLEGVRKITPEIMTAALQDDTLVRDLRSSSFYPVITTFDKKLRRTKTAGRDSP